MSAIAPHPQETDNLFAELDYRESDGIEISLLWESQHGSAQRLRVRYAHR